jgi:precorrin-2 dehydrogenase/sirohydrochlorin ferrochelatase
MIVVLIDLDLRGKTVLVVGGGKVGERKAVKFSAAGAKVVVASREFTEGVKQLGDEGKLQLVNIDLEMNPLGIDSWISNADLVIAATNDREINARIAEETKKKRTHTNVVDNPQLGDFTLPVVSRVGEFHIAISTGGKSPAMARVLRRKVEGIIAEEDVLMVRLQYYARELVKVHISNQLLRKKVLYKIMRDSGTRRFLKQRNFQEAKVRAKRIIKTYEKSARIGRVL